MKNIAGQQLLGLEAEQKTLLVHLDIAKHRCGKFKNI
jgi:hypothetical protein